MNFYGVGVALGGHSQNATSILQECLENSVWYMGFDEGDKENYEKIIAKIQTGDIIFAKSLHQTWKDAMRIKAIGFVSDEPLPNGYNAKMCISVHWFKFFEPSQSLKCLGLNFLEGINRRNTVFQETNITIIDKIKDMMKFDYKGELV